MMMKNHYALIREADGHANVLATFPFDRLAMAARRVHYWRTGELLEVAEVPRSAQEFINLCEHRDEIQRQLRELEDRTGGVHPALTTLWSLVAKDEEGVWRTVHEADTPIDEHVAKQLDELVSGT